VATAELQQEAGQRQGLVIPGIPQRYGADFRLAVDGVHVEKAGIDVAFPWTETGKSWHLGSYVRGRKVARNQSMPTMPSSGIVNAGLYASHDHADRLVPIFVDLTATRRRLPFTDPFKKGIQAGYVVPLYARRSDTYSKESWSIWNLCLLLAQRPELQRRLGEPTRTDRLVRDLKEHRLPAVRSHRGVRTESVEIRTAMRGASIAHPLGGRPVPGDILIDREAAISTIVNRMASIPYSKGDKANTKCAEEILDAEYFKIEPWPFAALVADNPL
jgi:hypothetical protein